MPGIFYPEDMKIRNYIFDTWKSVCRSYGFEEYDFPIIEPFEIFAAKTGEEIVNEQLYNFEDRGGRKLAVRPELTPGTVRLIAAKYKELPKPIKWFMIGNNWRAEKPQLGRGREFYQLEVNTFGIEDVVADAEIFSIIIDIMKAFGATKEMFSVAVSDRRLISALLQDTLGLNEEKSIAVRRLMDKKSKMDSETFIQTLSKTGLTEKQAKLVEEFMSSSLENLNKIIPDNVLSKNKGYEDIIKLFELLSDKGINDFVVFDPSIIRGFDYSDGLVYEVFDKKTKNNRSMFGGERFDKLIGIFGNFDLPATGFAMGDWTLLEFLKAWDLLPELQNETKFLLTKWPSEDEKYDKISQEVSEKLRGAGFNVETWLETTTKLEKQLKYADKKGIPNVIIIGEEEVGNNTITIKDMNSGEQETKPLEDFLKELS